MFDLERHLQRVGKTCFVKYFEEFKRNLPTSKYEKIITDDCLVSSKNTKSIAAKAIFKEKLEIDALQNIVKSQKVSEDVRQEASRLIQKYN